MRGLVELRPHRASARLAVLAAAVLLVACVGGANEVRTEAVIWFDEYNEVFTGQALRTGSILAGGVIDVTNSRGEVRCVGHSRAHIVPPGAGDGNCDGLAGVALLSCSDGRQIQLEYQVDDGCHTGYGSGRDQDGRVLHSVFGGSAAHARTIADEARDHLKAKPGLPAMEAGAAAVGGEARTSTGTAFFVSWEGHLVTNHHVVEDRKQVHVKLANGDMVRAKVLAKDAENDLALLRVDLIREPLALRVEAPLVKGEDVFALGYPLVALQGQEQKATFGRVNALSGIQGDARYAQVDVPIQPGNSGGPLLDRQGEVVGVVTAMLSQGRVLEVAGVVPQNVNYALKSTIVDEMLGKDIVEVWTPAKRGRAAAEYSELVAAAADSVVLVIAW